MIVNNCNKRLMGESHDWWLPELGSNSFGGHQKDQLIDWSEQSSLPFHWLSGPPPSWLRRPRSWWRWPLCLGARHCDGHQWSWSELCPRRTGSLDDLATSVSAAGFASTRVAIESKTGRRGTGLFSNGAARTGLQGRNLLVAVLAGAFSQWVALMVTEVALRLPPMRWPL